MIKYITIFIILFVVGIGLAEAKTQVYRFVTLGNCYSCTVRIEEATQNIAGLDSAYYDYETDITTVKFDDEKITINKIMQIVANCGHDTEWYRAPNGAYIQLIGTCCEYERTIDYSKAKIGYLSLMDMWLSVLDRVSGIARVYPDVIEKNRLIIESQNFEVSNSSYRIFDLSGKEMGEGSLNLSGITELCLDFIPSGQYFIILENDNKCFYKSLVRKL